MIVQKIKTQTQNATFSWDKEMKWE